jgi:non-specific serine/threonine protein kinase/serine/threonine-protein kinase
MTPERWEKIKDVLGSALELPDDDRPLYLDQQCGSDLSLRHEVELLLRGERSIEPQFLGETSLAEVAAALIPTEENPWIGRRVGVYKIVEQIGSGGMGEVYRAFRADDQYRKEVALKVIRAGQDSGSVIARFKNERQILASLEHPNIARLLDGGTTEDGVPYFAMELIEGRPITEYCDEKRLSIVDRLRLFVQICGAVQYAHQHLIIHRDIKPGNILVTAEGTPKLLDFGIAKIVDVRGDRTFTDSTVTAFRVLTPRYSSPEQIHGDSITTASDVYSLGIVLYELLTGQSPYRLATSSPQEMIQAVCNTEPQRPSVAVYRVDLSHEPSMQRADREERSGLRDSSPDRLRKRLNGDLDNIVLMALEKDRARRYSSVEQLQEDIRRHLENIPVTARNGTAWYRASKFVTRHKAGVAFTGTFALALLAGMAITLHEARVARMERARAEMRFNDVRKLANSLMFEIHDSIRDLAGATPARKLLVERAREYLDSLSKEASGDLSLQRELAAAYDRVGDLQGYDGAANLGDVAGALLSYKKALAIRAAAAAANPDNAAIQSDLLRDYFRLSFVLLSAGDYAGALSDLHSALPIAQKLADTQADPMYKDFLAGFYWQTGTVQNQAGDYLHAAENFRQAASIRAVPAKANVESRTHLAGDYIGLATALQKTGQIGPAIEASNEGLRLTEELSQSNPTNATFREYLGEAYNLAAPLQEQKGDVNLALEYYRNAHRIFAGLRNADPANSLARDNFGFSDLGIAKELLRKHQIQAAFPPTREAIATFELIEQETRYDMEGQAQSYETMGLAFAALADLARANSKKAADLREARSWLQKSLHAWERDSIQGASDPVAGYESNRVRRELANCESTLAKI